MRIRVISSRTCTDFSLERQFPHLPWNSAENEQKSVVDVKPELLLADLADPVDLHSRQRLHLRMGPGEWNAHPQPDEDANQLDDVGVSDRVQSAEKRVEHGDAGGENHGLLLLHVNDDCQCGA